MPLRKYNFEQQMTSEVHYKKYVSSLVSGNTATESTEDTEIVATFPPCILCDRKLQKTIMV